MECSKDCKYGNTTMKLYDLLQRAKSEEDVKSIYIRKLFLTEVTMGTIDIKSNEVWVETKKGSSVSYYKMFAQLLNYVDTARKEDTYIPPLLAVLDQKKAALMKTSDALKFLKKENITWGKVPSNPLPTTVSQIAKYIGTHFREFNLEADGGVAFVEEFKHARQHDEFIREKITSKNLKTVFKVWMEMIGCEIIEIGDTDRHRLFFFTDIINDGKVATRSNLPAKLLFEGDTPVFELKRKTYRLRNMEGYRNFWMLYHRPPDEEYQKSLMRRSDKLIPTKKRMRKGAYYTPDWVVAKAYDTLAKTLGKNWQKEYTVWDMCCGVGNLEEPHKNYRKVFMSTLDDVEIELMKSDAICVGAERFQYDYLNDDITDDGKIKYSPNSPIPQELRDAIKKGKKILVLMNPPYAEASNARRGDDPENKEGVAKTKIARVAMQDLGKASNELFTQFLARIAIEMPTATIAMFSTLKYVNAPNFETFRQNWNAEYKDGFIVESRAFEKLDSEFPIGFLIWKTYHGTNKNHTIDKISIEAFDKNEQYVETKDFYNLPNEKMLNQWIDRPKANNEPRIPLKNAVSPAVSKPRVKYWSDGAIAYMSCAGNDFQQAHNLTALYSSGFSNGNGFYVTRDNLEKAAMTFTMRRIIPHTWIIHNDQFLIPTEPLTDDFKNDCLIWMLFHDKNLTAGADRLEWNGEEWTLVNHFIPFSQSEVNPQGDKFKSAFMAEYLEDKKLSPEALAVMAEGCKLWKTFFDKSDPYKTRKKYQLGRSDVGWYQIRKTLKKRNENDIAKTYLTDFNESYERLGDKLRPMVFDLGFLPPNN